MNWKSRGRGLSLNLIFIYPYIYEAGTAIFSTHIGTEGFKWEYDIDIPSFMTNDDDSSIFRKSRIWK